MIQDFINSNGRAVAHAFRVVTDNVDALYHYGKLIACYAHGKLYLTDYHDYSVTTSKHCKEYTGMNVNERRAYLKEHADRLVEQDFVRIEV